VATYSVKLQRMIVSICSIVVEAQSADEAADKAEEFANNHDIEDEVQFDWYVTDDEISVTEDPQWCGA
jgi:hypothetical protein